MARYAPLALGTFFGLATLVCLVTAASFFLPDSPFAAIWKVKPVEYEELRALGPLVAWGFLALAAVMALAALGTLRRKIWGYRLALAIFAANLLGDMVRLARGDWAQGLVGILVVAIVLALLARPAVRARFGR